MNTQDIVSEISELSLTYSMLAQQMLAKDRDAALSRLDISEEPVGILLMMSPVQIVKLASTNMMLCHFRFDDHATLGLVTQPHRDKGLQQSQMSILLARQAVEQISRTVCGGYSIGFRDCTLDEQQAKAGAVLCVTPTS